MNDYPAQIPAQGILLHRDYGDTQIYDVPCDCSCGEHTIKMWIEAEDTSVTLTMYREVTTAHWKRWFGYGESRLNWLNDTFVNDWLNRLKICWIALTKGYIQMETSTILNEQQALNVGTTILRAVNDVKSFKEKQNEAKKSIC